MRARGIEFDTEISGGAASPALFWGHALMGSMQQEEDSEIMPWSDLAETTRLIRWDARGHGVSEATLNDEDYRWPELAKDLWAIADGLDLDDVILGGISMGAGTALHAAVMAPKRTTGLVLMAPPTAWSSRARQARLYRGAAKAFDAVGLTPFSWAGELGSYFARNKSLGKLQRSVMRGLRCADPRPVRAALLGAALSDLPDREALEALEVPTLILAWANDSSHPLSTAETLNDWLPNASLEVARSARDIRKWPTRLETFVAGLR